MTVVREMVSIVAVLMRWLTLLCDDALLLGWLTATLSVVFRFLTNGHNCSWRRVFRCQLKF